MEKYVIVVYDVYNLGSNYNSATKVEKWERVKFCKENIEYNDKISYEENVRNFVDECIENQSVCIGEAYIPLHNIHGWYFDKDRKEAVKPVPKPKKSPKKHKNNRRTNRTGRKTTRSKGSAKKAEANLPFEVNQ